MVIKKNFWFSIWTSKKAFDSVPHYILLQKNEMLGIDGNFLKIVASYLSKRKQYVKLKAFNSETVQVTSGVHY